MTKLLRKSNALIILAIMLTAVFISACSKNANTGNSTNSTNTSTTNRPANTSTGTPGAGSPTAAIRAYYQAAINKDYETAKKYLSAGTIKLMEEEAKKENKSFDEAFKASINESGTTTMPEFSNEQISGDTATVDIKGSGDEQGQMPLVKEGGEWKLALDKLVDELKKAFGELEKEASKDEKDEHGGHNEK
jgi:hypothetical protein